jgi:hypothetical protein
MKPIKILITSLVVWVIIFLWFIQSPFLEAYVSSLLLLTWTVIAIFTAGNVNELMQDDEDIVPPLKWLTSATTILILVIWTQVMHALYPFLPPFWH